MIKTLSDNEGSAASLLSFEARDVTGMQRVQVSDVQRDVPAGVVARSLAARMSLSDEVPWALRDDATSVFLDDDVAIGEQLAPESHVTVTPKTHLG